MADVTITGATGFVGGALAGRLRARGDHVVALVRTRSDALEAIGVTQQVVDLTDLDAVTAALTGADALVHAAAGAGPDLATARITNRDATRTLVDAARRVALPRFVHVSTTSVYDTDAIGDTQATEDAAMVAEPAPGTPGSSAASPYAITKAEAEAEVARGAAEGLSVAVLRPPAVLGAGATSTWGTTVPTMVRDGALPVRNPAATFGYVAIDDLVDALLAALDGAATGTVNVVGGHRTIGEYLRAVHAIIGTDAPLPLSDDEPAWRGRYATDRLPAVLGVTPRVGFDDAMATIAAAWPTAAVTSARTDVTPVRRGPATATPRSIPIPLTDEQATRLRWMLEDPDSWALRPGWVPFLLHGDEGTLVNPDDLTRDQRIAAVAWLDQQQHLLYRVLEGGRRAPDGWISSFPIYARLRGG